MCLVDYFQASVTQTVSPFGFGVSDEQPAGMSGRGRLLPATEAGRRFASNLTEATLHDNPDGFGCKVEFEFIKIARKIAMPKQQTMDWEVIFEHEYLGCFLVTQYQIDPAPSPLHQL